MINRINGFIEEKNGDKYLNIASTDRNSEVLKNMQKFGMKLKTVLKKINNSEFGEYDKDYMKIKFNSDDDILLNKQLIFPTITVIIKNIFENIDFSKSNKSVECMICHYWYFKDIVFKHQPYVCNGCHDFSMIFQNLDEVLILRVKSVDYRSCVVNISKKDAIRLLNNSLLNNKGVL